MKLNRRIVLAIAAAATVVSPLVWSQTPAPAPSAEQRLVELALANLHPITFADGKFSGPGWNLLVREGAAAEFTLMGEEHGAVETPILAKELFLALRPAGYDTLGIEISSPIAEDLDKAARKGVDGITELVKANWPGMAFYNWKTEAELVAAARAAVPGGRDVLWGLDYEVLMDRRLIDRLWAKAGSQRNALTPSLTRLDVASQEAWKAWRDTHDPSKIFTFSGDPQLVRDVRAAWKKPDADVRRILTTLEETLEINRLFVSGKGYASNERRSALMRANFVDHLERASAERRKPRALVKMGENHVMRGVNWTGNFDVGSLIHEVAEMRGGRAFSFLVGGGQGSRHAVTDPTVFRFVDSPSDMFDSLQLDFLAKAVSEPGPMLVDLRPLRAVLSSGSNLTRFGKPEAAKVIFSFDCLLIWNDTTATSALAPTP